MKQKPTIGITDCSKYSNYQKWILDADANIDVMKLSYLLNNADDVSKCDGIILTGGEDVHPKFYNKDEYFSFLDASQIDEVRDDFEWKIIDKTFALKKPLLGICRGLQVMNVYLGGTLIYDIPSVKHSHQHGKINGVDQTHQISADKNSLLHQITRASEGEVNSAHHQSVAEVAKDLKVSATSSEIIEAMEWKDGKDKSWMLLVQWHPERMPDQLNPFASNIRAAFLNVCKQ